MCKVTRVGEKHEPFCFRQVSLQVRSVVLNECVVNGGHFGACSMFRVFEQSLQVRELVEKEGNMMMLA